MGTIGDKLNYLSETKDLLKEAIRNKGVDISDTDTFRSYAEKLDSMPLYNAQLDNSTFAPSSSTEMSKLMYRRIQKLPPITLNTTFSSNLFNDLQGLLEVPEITFLKTITASNATFYNCKSLTEIPLFDTSSVTNFNSFAYGCDNLTTIPLYDTSKVTNMYQAFYQCKSLTEIPLFDTSSVTNTQHMFSICSSLTTVPAFDFSSITNTKQMFYYCVSLTTVPAFDFSNNAGAIDGTNMFQSCNNLTDVSLFDTSKFEVTGYMFNGCSALTTVPELDLSSATDASNMFYSCRELSDESLNNILASCITATKLSTKTLKYIGLTSSQATTCTGLSNYQAFLDAGWTTGY